ncbi:DUF362 domain-containing protein, partial [Treponema sp. R80B11-R83G3]
MKTNVYVARCDSYEKADEKIKDLLNLMGGIGQFAKNGEKITLKANLLGASPPERAVSTHPSIIAAVGKLAKKEGAIPLIADSPGSGYLYNEATLKKLYKTCGIYEAAKEYIEAKKYFWNSGMFVFKVKTYLDEIDNHSNDIYVASQEAFKNSEIKNNII